MNIDVSRASVEERPIVKRLLQLCLHDYTSHYSCAIEDDGLFAYEWLEFYWSSPRRHPYLLRLENRLAGFVFVREREEDEPGEWQWQIAEFFVLRGLRGRKIGTTAALEVIRSRPGLWNIGYDTANEPARNFWTTIAKTFDPTIEPEPAGTGRARFRLRVSGSGP